jgi:hypothetical protein
MKSNHKLRDGNLFETNIVSLSSMTRAIRFRLVGGFPVLLSLEPESSYPLNHSIFARLFSTRVDFGKPFNENSIRWPINDELLASDPTKTSSSERKNQIAFVASNRCTASRKSNYAFRRHCIEYRDLLKLEVVGRNWNDSGAQKLKVATKAAILSMLALKFPSLLELKSYVRFPTQKIEEVENKNDFLLGFKYSLVIENESTYVSEKLLEALVAGTLPIYIGPDIPENWIPSSLYLRCQPNLKSLREVISKLSSIDYSNHLAMTRRWLESPSARLWSRNLVFRQVSERSMISFRERLSSSRGQ